MELAVKNSKNKITVSDAIERKLQQIIESNEH